MKNALSHIEKRRKRGISTVEQILDLIIPRLVLNMLSSTLDIHQNDTRVLRKPGGIFFIDPSLTLRVTAIREKE